MPVSMWDPGNLARRAHLFLKVTNGVIVCIREEMGDGRMCFPDVILYLIHHKRAVSL